MAVCYFVFRAAQTDRARRAIIAVTVYLAPALFLFYVNIIQLQQSGDLPLYLFFIVCVPLALYYVAYHFDVLRARRTPEPERSRTRRPATTRPSASAPGSAFGSTSVTVKPRRGVPAASSAVATRGAPAAPVALVPGPEPSVTAVAEPVACEPVVIEPTAEPFVFKPSAKPEPKLEPEPRPKPVRAEKEEAPMDDELVWGVAAPRPVKEAPEQPQPAEKALETKPEKPVAETAPAEKPAAETAPAEKPAAETAPAEKPAAEEAPKQQQPIAEAAPPKKPAAEAAPAQELTFASCFAHADRVKEKGYPLIAADLYHRSRAIAANKQDEKRALFAEVKCYLDGGNLEAARTGVEILRDDYELSSVEGLKLNAMTTFIKG